MTTAAASGPSLTPRFTRREVVTAVALGLAVEVAVLVGVQRASLQMDAFLPEIDRGAGVPVRVKPVLDLDHPMLKLGGKLDPNKLLDRWNRKTKTELEERRTFVSTKASKDAKDTPPKDVPMADAGTKPPDPDAGLVAKKEDDPEAADAAPSNTPGKGDPSGVKEGTEEDPLKAQAASVYKGRLVSWLSAKFAGVHGTGLGEEAILALGCSVSVTIGADRKVLSYSLGSSSNAAFDAAAKAALESAKGQEIPPPPENHPDLAPSSLSVRFVCKKGQCD